MTTVPATINDFAGLDVTSPADEAGCINLHDVTFAQPGCVRARDGQTWVANTSVSSATTLVIDPLPATSGFVVSVDQAAHVYNSSATRVATSIAGVQLFSRFTPHGTPTTHYAYAGSTTANKLWRTNGATISEQSISVTGAGFTDVFQTTSIYETENRLVAATEDNSGQDVSRVRFSAPGDALTWATNDYVDLTPGDGDEITALVSWNGMVFAFKNNKFFVFYGTSVDATGNSIFNYRTVKHPGPDSPFAVCTGPEGVFFLNSDGVFVTTGGQPQRISGPVDPWLAGLATPYFTGTAAAVGPATPQAAYYQRTLIFTFEGYQLLYHLDRGKWTYWTLPINAVGTWQVGTTCSLLTARAANATIHKLSSATTDSLSSGTTQAITAAWQSGFSNFGTDANKRIRGAKAWGSGATTTFAAAHDFGTVGSSDTLGWGSSTGIGRARRGTRGELLSFQLSGTAPWRCERIEVQLAGIRQDNPQAQATA